MEFISDKFLKMVSNMEKVLFFTSMDDHMRESLIMILKKVKDMSTFLMDQRMLEILRMDIKKGKEFFNGRMGKYMMVNGKQERKMGVECGKDQMEILTLENGKKAKCRDLEFLFRKEVIDTRDSSKIQWNMAWERKDMKMEIHMWAYFPRIDLMDKGKFIIEMVTISKEISQMGYVMEME